MFRTYPKFSNISFHIFPAEITFLCIWLHNILGSTVNSVDLIRLLQKQSNLGLYCLHIASLSEKHEGLEQFQYLYILLGLRSK